MVKKVGTEVGHGQLDFTSLIQAANAHAVEWLTVEQEYFEIDRFEALKINVTNLEKLMGK